ncbi:serine/threonine-protein kinase [Mycoplasma marinum]|uniref:Serine/threonine protein kinase n=1 Tax=Mycoplasma marinum TaxID=1937190 RepID=A0A4R0XUW8_9MOLU|nr:serine/threonine-protein kinase [Mycoplasma marinum]TCG10691.1 serine/threonine protein kinase [Mycoplasma marinum]
MLEKIDDKYKIISKIGQGGMAEIYLAEDMFDHKRVAIKVLHPDKKNDIVAMKRFNSEMKLTKTVDSPYVVKIYDWKLNEKVQYIVMEYVEGSIFKDYIEQRTKLTVDEAIEFSKQLALGFAEIHKRGIVHRDIKSSNIMISDHGKVKIIDFGIALTEESDRLTRSDSIIGSVQYLAPEILDQEKPSHKWDIYALGILMYEMLTGSCPYNEKDALATALKHKNSTVPMVNKTVESIPQSVANVVARATAKDKNKRHSDMIAFYQDLSNALDTERIYEKPINLSAKEKKNFFSIMNSKWTLIGILSFTFIALIIVIITVLVVK